MPVRQREEIQEVLWKECVGAMLSELAPILDHLVARVEEMRVYL